MPDDRILHGVAQEPRDRQASDVVHQHWTDFARTGNPNGGAVANANIRPMHGGIFLEWARST